MLVCTFLKFSISMSISHSHERSFIGHIRDQIEILTDKINFRKYITKAVGSHLIKLKYKMIFLKNCITFNLNLILVKIIQHMRNYEPDVRRDRKIGDELHEQQHV